MGIIKLPLRSWEYDTPFFMYFFDKLVDKICINKDNNRLAWIKHNILCGILIFVRYTAYFKIVNAYGVFPPDGQPARRIVPIYQYKNKKNGNGVILIIDFKHQKVYTMVHLLHHFIQF